jgi:two-component system CheB/CheR fusion protein
VPIYDDQGRIDRWAGIHLDIARLKLTEQALREADRRKDEFLATLAHELRNPLAPIRNSVYILNAANAGTAQRQLVRNVMERPVLQMSLLPVEESCDPRTSTCTTEQTIHGHS